MADPAPKKIDQQNYWRYIFAPMFMIVIGFGLYILFTMNDSQSMSLDSVTKQVNSMSGITNAPLNGRINFHLPVPGASFGQNNK